jgi:hypothetical protein
MLIGLMEKGESLKWKLQGFLFLVVFGEIFDFESFEGSMPLFNSEILIDFLLDFFVFILELSYSLVSLFKGIILLLLDLSNEEDNVVLLPALKRIVPKSFLEMFSEILCFLTFKSSMILISS